jgi:hypothetical protein
MELQKEALRCYAMSSVPFLRAGHPFRHLEVLWSYGTTTGVSAIDSLSMGRVDVSARYHSESEVQISFAFPW